MTLMLMLQKHIQRAMKGMATGAFLDAPVADIYDLPPITDVTWMNERGQRICHAAPGGGALRAYPGADRLWGHRQAGGKNGAGLWDAGNGL